MTKIRYYRTKLGMSQADLAKKLNIHTTTVVKWETGKSSPRASRIKDIAKILNCSVNDLFNNTF